MLAAFLDEEAETLLKMAKLAFPNCDPFYAIKVDSRSVSSLECSLT